jgi:hypothetical protein
VRGNVRWRGSSRRAHALGRGQFLRLCQPVRQIPAQFPEFTALVIAFNMSLPMAAWTRFRGMEWRPIAEMSGAMFALAIVLIGLPGPESSIRRACTSGSRA